MYVHGRDDASDEENNAMDQINVIVTFARMEINKLTVCYRNAYAC